MGYAYPNGNGIGGPLIGVGRYVAQGLSNLNKETGQGNPALDWTYGAHGIVVEVDPDTGEYEVLKIASVFDVGTGHQPRLVRGQSIGGMIQGLGTAVCEGYIYDDKGSLLNPSFTDNKIPTAKDIPVVIESAVVETPQVDGPYGARGVGEHSMISVAAALGNAISASHRRRAGPHAPPIRGCLAGAARQDPHRQLDHEVPRRALSLGASHRHARCPETRGATGGSA